MARRAKVPEKAPIPPLYVVKAVFDGFSVSRVCETDAERITALGELRAMGACRRLIVFASDGRVLEELMPRLL